MNRQEIDWEQLSRVIGAFSEHGEMGGSDYARLAIIELIGEEALRDAVDFYVSHRRGRELARSVLWQLQPSTAMERCYQIYREDKDIERRRSAIELLRAVGDWHILPWIEEFWSDPDETIQNWGVGVLDQMIFDGRLDPALAEVLLSRGETHSNRFVRETISSIRNYLRERQAGI